MECEVGCGMWNAGWFVEGGGGSWKAEVGRGRRRWVVEGGGGLWNAEVGCGKWVMEGCTRYLVLEGGDKNSVLVLKHRTRRKHTRKQRRKNSIQSNAKH